MRLELWRLCFIAAGALILIGGPQHPRGTMEQMLADPKWIPSHSLMLAGFVAMLAGLINYSRTRLLPAATRRWTGLAAVGTVLQAVEMAVHTAASVDHGHLVAGHATPVLTTHLWLSILLYPVFAFTVIGWILATARDRSLASRWIGWLGIVGAVCHGSAPLLVLVLEVPWGRILFPMVLFLAIWLVLAGVWPIKERALAEVVPAGA